MRPFDVVRDEGFLKIADELVAAGARYGTLSAKELLPHPTTVSRKAAEVASSLRERLRPEIKAAMEHGRGSTTVDMWTDDYKKTAYATATVHYVDDDWELNNLELFTSDFPPEKKTGDHIRRQLVRRCAKFELDESLLENVVFVSDQGANVISALRPYKRVGCTAHVLNAVLRHTFDDDFLGEDLRHVRAQLQNVKAVVNFLKQSGLSSQLPYGVNEEVSTRRNSEFAMLTSVYMQYEEIEALLDSRGNPMMEEVSKTAIKEIIDFLTPFKEATDMLEKEKQPTLPLVLLCKTKLEKHLTLAPAVSSTIAALKMRAREFLQRKLELSELHKMATFFWPPLRQLRALEEDERSEVYARPKIASATASSNDNEEYSLGSAVLACIMCLLFLLLVAYFLFCLFVTNTQQVTDTFEDDETKTPFDMHVFKDRPNRPKDPNYVRRDLRGLLCHSHVDAFLGAVIPSSCDFVMVDVPFLPPQRHPLYSYMTTIKINPAGLEGHILQHMKTAQDTPLLLVVEPSVLRSTAFRPQAVIRGLVQKVVDMEGHGIVLSDHEITDADTADILEDSQPPQSLLNFFAQANDVLRRCNKSTEKDVVVDLFKVSHHDTQA
ncbi:hypothetical protein MTO96_015763 [Rhipicephalus appendiculatus]